MTPMRTNCHVIDHMGVTQFAWMLNSLTQESIFTANRLHASEISLENKLFR